MGIVKVRFSELYEPVIQPSAPTTGGRQRHVSLGEFSNVRQGWITQFSQGIPYFSLRRVKITTLRKTQTIILPRESL